MTQDMKKDTILHTEKGTYVHRLINICSSAHEHMFIGSRTYVHKQARQIVRPGRTGSPLEADRESAWGGLQSRFHFASLAVRLLLLLLMVTAGATTTWGQITPTTDTSNPVYYLFQSFGNTSFYMRPNNNNTNAAVSTSNILTDDMKWYFLDSGDGYYYICDKDGNYLYFSKPSGSTSNRTYMVLKSLDNNDTEHYKFSIAKNNTKGWDAYNIIPYGNTDKYCLNKQGRNAGTNGVQVSNGWDDENSNWVIIPMTTYAWTLRDDCFRPSDSSNKYFYQIKSKVDASYYIKPGTTYVETSNTVDDDMIWYFEEATSDDYMTYYYIRLANDGQYLKYRANGDNAIQLANHTGSETGDAEDSFQFIVVRGAVSNEPWNTTDISYNIVPKLLKRTNNNINFYCVSSNKGLGMPLKIRNDRAGTDNKWTFVSVDFPTEKHPSLPQQPVLPFTIPQTGQNLLLLMEKYILHLLK